MNYDNQESRIASLRNLKPGARIHLSGICGTGMAAVGKLLKDYGFYVVGSDRAFYPPMGEVVRSFSMELFSAYDVANFSTRPDFVIIGNTIRRDNPEAEFVMNNQIPYASMPEVFNALLIGTRDVCPNSIVISGTHGKTTTSAAVAWMLECAGRSPGYFIGGAPNNLPDNVRAVNHAIPLSQRAVVLEGDEYDSAFFSKQPKFLSYRPDILAITSVEFDHADIYISLEQIESEFEKLVQLVPASGVIFLADHTERLCELGRKWEKRLLPKILGYGNRISSPLRILDRSPCVAGPSGEFGQRLHLQLNTKQLQVWTSLSGIHNAYNLLVCAAIGEHLDIPSETISEAIARFSGVRRRQTVLHDANHITIVEDFAHHPTAVSLTLQGLRESYKNRRIIAVFEPRSNTSKRDFFQNAYAKSFSAADLIIIRDVLEAGDYSKFGEEMRALDVERIVEDLRCSGKEAWHLNNSTEILDLLRNLVKEKDVVVFMSNGDFDSLPSKFKATLCQAQ